MPRNVEFTPAVPFQTPLVQQREIPSLALLARRVARLSQLIKERSGSPIDRVKSYDQLPISSRFYVRSLGLPHSASMGSLGLNRI